MPASQTAETAPPARRGGDPGFGLYVHWPFCKAKCPYCDFNSHVRDAVPQDRWRAALLAELAAMAARTPHRRLDSIFFGGGTPSLMPPETAAAVIAAARRHWPVADDLEITLEANPTSVEAGRFRALADEAGVNRLSLGVQSLDPDALRFLGRGHSADEARAAIALARRHFPRVSFDLIYALPGQSLEAWRAQLTEALARAGGHLSLVAGVMADDGDPAATTPLERSGNRVAAIVAYFPPTDLDVLLAGRERSGTIDFDESLRAAISPVHFADAKDPPTLIITGDSDKGVPPSQSEAMQAALNKAGVENKLIQYPGADHDFYVKGDPVKTDAYALEAMNTMVAWFEQHLN